MMNLSGGSGEDEEIGKSVLFHGHGRNGVQLVNTITVQKPWFGVRLSKLKINESNSEQSAFQIILTISATHPHRIMSCFNIINWKRSFLIPIEFLLTMILMTNCSSTNRLFHFPGLFLGIVYLLFSTCDAGSKVSFPFNRSSYPSLPRLSSSSSSAALANRLLQAHMSNHGGHSDRVGGSWRDEITDQCDKTMRDP